MYIDTPFSNVHACIMWYNHSEKLRLAMKSVREEVRRYYFVVNGFATDGKESPAPFVDFNINE